MARHRAKILSERELEVMNALWKLGKATVKEIWAEMGGDRAGACTSIATMLKFLEHKGVIRHEEKRRTFYYIPRTSKELEQRKALDHVLKIFFDGNVNAMLLTLQASPRIDRDSWISASKIFTAGHP